MKILVIAATSIVTASATPFTLCGGVADLLGVETVTVSPEPVTPGEDVVVRVSGHLGANAEAFRGGRAEVDIRVMGITYLSLNFDVCSELSVDCPALAGEEWAANLSYPVPWFVPGGLTARIEVNVSDYAGKLLSCALVSERVERSKPGLRGVGDAEPSQPTRAEVEFLFEAWRRQHGLEFESPAEYVDRLEIFYANHLRLVQHNADLDSTRDDALEHSQFSHLTIDELFAAMHSPLDTSAW
jgi:hypothetical protein